MGLLPTPVHRFAPPGLPEGVDMWIKRDDLTGMQLSGNKVGPPCFESVDGSNGSSGVAARLSCCTGPDVVILVQILNAATLLHILSGSA